MTGLVDWRALFNDIRVPWKDRGASTGRNHVNIPCPFCRDDGYHLGIREDREVFHCWKCGTAGGNYLTLLIRLGQPRFEGAKLLNKYRGDRGYEDAIQDLRQKHAQHDKKLPRDEQSLMFLRWERFRPASGVVEALDYMHDDRDFRYEHEWMLKELLDYYDLRVGSNLMHPGRLLFPLYASGQRALWHQQDAFMGWTGRSMRGREPKYMTSLPQGEHPVYVPRMVRSTMLIVEGPFDALRIDAAMRADGVGAVALTGKEMISAHLVSLRAMMPFVRRFFFVPDRDVPISQTMRAMHELRAALSGKNVVHIRLPDDVKDAGEMTNAAVRQWLSPLAR